jgi:ribosomal protein S18 acetylase RimI-like enzyme
MIQIEHAFVGDFLKIAQLDRTAWAQNLNSEYIPDGEHVWRIWIEHALVFCAKESDGVLGVALAFPTLEGSFCVHKVFVDKAYRGKGIAGRLFEALFLELDTMDAGCFLTVDPANENAIRLYEKWGFTNCQHIPGYYREDEDRLVLERPSKSK